MPGDSSSSVVYIPEKSHPTQAAPNLHIKRKLRSMNFYTKREQISSDTDSCKTSNDILWCRDVGSEESTIEEVGCGGNEDVEVDEWSHQAGQN